MQCRNCGAMFEHSERSLYCSYECKRSAQNRRYYQRKKEEVLKLMVLLSDTDGIVESLIKHGFFPMQVRKGIHLVFVSIKSQIIAIVNGNEFGLCTPAAQTWKAEVSGFVLETILTVWQASKEMKHDE